jgi:hypothetical protein
MNGTEFHNFGAIITKKCTLLLPATLGWVPGIEGIVAEMTIYWT